MTSTPGTTSGAASALTSQLSIEKEKQNEYSRSSDDAASPAHETKPEDPSGQDSQGLEDLTRIATSDYPHAFKLTFIIVALALSVFLVSLDMTIVATAIPRITDEFHSLDQVGWYASAFFLTVGAFQSTWGKAYKYFPLKPTFLISIGIFELGSLICGVAQDSTTLIVGRAIAGKSSIYRFSVLQLTIQRRGWGWHWFRCLHHRCVCSATRAKTGIHWSSWGSLWSC